jgi:hypothetical protein
MRRGGLDHVLSVGLRLTFGGPAGTELIPENYGEGPLLR